MQPSALETTRLPASSEPKPSDDELRQAVTRAANLLPLPGPVTAFAFLNTLQALEDMPFDAGIRKGARLYGSQPYLSEDRYREKMVQGRIGTEDIAAVLRKDLGESADLQIASLVTKFELQLAMLQFPLRFGPPEELRWFVAVTDALTRLREEAPRTVRARFIEETQHWVMRDLRNASKKGPHRRPNSPEERRQSVLTDLIQRFGESSIEQWSEETWEALSLQALWRVCRDGVEGIDVYEPPLEPAVRHRDVLLGATGEDSDVLVHDVLIRFCAAFTDQGFAHWQLPYRDEGFYKAFCHLYREPAGPPNRWMRGLSQELGRLQDADVGPMESIQQSLKLLGVDDEEMDDFVTATLLALRGWAGMLWQMEVRSDRVPLPVPPGTLIEFLAVRLILERFALAYVAREKLDYSGPLQVLRDAAHQWTMARATNIEQRAFLVFQLAQVLGWVPPALFRLSKKQWSALVTEIESFSSLERRRLLHLAFERHFRTQTLDALAVHTKRTPARVASPRFQISFCIDAREESFRRHLEEIAPDVETFGAAGFYGVAMYYRGVADAHYAALCPIVIKPQHWVVEDVVYTLEESNRRRAKTRRAIGTASHQFHVGSRSIAGGAVLTASLGVLASIPLVARVLFPRVTATIRRIVGDFVQPPPVTRLRLERMTPNPGKGEDEIGYSLEEMANIGERQLRDIGLTSSFARLVMILGHGSFCLNNPHKSAYDCGACSGSAGGPNGRALSIILNDLRVREILAQRGLHIPSDTRFIGGMHNTCKDVVTFFDLDLLPKSHLNEFEAARDTLDEVCERNAHERCRRFESAPLDLSFEAARLHVEERSEDLAQTRPEFGNASNAICFVGRRARTRGLYLDRRSFLTSYDPTQDDAECTILARILAAAVPVCEGINMQYFLSYIDSPGWACGTKLPHNVTSLLGVMDGAASDLRPGLPWQSVEIHEPVRLIFVIEASPQAMFKIMERNEVVGRILKNGWAQLAVLDPNSNQIQVYRGGEFVPYEPTSSELPSAECSTDWYRGWRDHLGFAVIDPQASTHSR